MIPPESAVYLTIPALTLEVILMVYVYQLNPQDKRNQIYAVYMLLLATNACGVLVVTTAFTREIALVGAWMNAFTALITGPMLWIVVGLTFAPPMLRRHGWALPLLLLMAIPTLLLLVDAIMGTTFLMDTSQVNRANGTFVSIQHYLSGSLATIFFTLNVIVLNIGVGFLLLALALFKRTPPATRRILWYLVIGFVFSGIIATEARHMHPVLGGIIDPLLVAIITGLIISRFQILSPVVSGLWQAIENANFGLVVMDKNWYVQKINSTAYQLLHLSLDTAPNTANFAIITTHLAQKIQNPAEATTFSQRVLREPGRVHQVEFLLPQDGDGQTNGQFQYLITRIEPIYEEGKTRIGSLCTIHDLTAERRARHLIAQANQALQEHIKYIARLNEITLAATGNIDLPDLLQMLADQLGDLFAAESCYVSLWDEAGKTAIPAASYGEMRDSYTSIRTYPDEQTITKSVLASERPLLIENSHHSPYISSRLAMMFPEQSLLALPLIVADQKLGAAIIAYPRSHPIKTEDVIRGEQVAGQIALALAKSKLFQAEREQRMLAESLREAGTALSATLDPDTVMDEILQYIEPVVPYDSANLMLVQGDTIHVVRMRGYEKYEPAIAEMVKHLQLSITNTSNLRRMQTTKRPYIVPDILQDKAWISIGELTYFRSWAGAPIVAQGHVIAFFSLEKREPDFYRPLHAQRLAAFAGQAALALQNAQWFATIRQRQAELETLFALSTALHVATMLPDILELALQNGIEITQSCGGCIYLAEPEENVELFKHAPCACAIGETKRLPHPYDIRQYLHAAYHSYHPIYIPLPLYDDHLNDKTIGCIALSLKTQDQIIGIMLLAQATSSTLSAQNRQLLIALAEMVSGAAQRAQIMETLEQQVSRRTYELTRTNARLAELDQLKSKLINDISHELRTPITNIQLYLDLMERGKTEKHPKYLAVLQEKIKILIRLTEDILHISQLSLYKTRAKFAPTDMNEIAQSLLQKYQIRAVNAGLTMTLQPAADLPQVMAEHDLLVQGLSKLLDNALAYTTSGEITIITAMTDTAVTIIVRDTGMGIVPDEQLHIFDRFYRGRQVSQSTIPGSGLGLAIAKEIIELHDGTIVVESEAHTGTTFCVTFPQVI